MGTQRGLERLIFFTDAVAAIAITLLVLPLVDVVTSLTDRDHDYPGGAGGLLWDNRFGILAFVISFAVIARLWLSHHAIFEHVKNYNARLLMLTLVWAFTIVLLPFPTALTWAFSTSRVTVAFYIGTMLVNSLLLTAMAFYIRRTSEIQSTENPVSGQTLQSSVTASSIFLFAFVVGVAIPAVNFYGLLAFALWQPALTLVQRIRRARAARAHRTR